VVNVMVTQQNVTHVVVSGRKSPPLLVQVLYFLLIGWWMGFPFGVLGLKFLPAAFFLAF